MKRKINLYWFRHKQGHGNFRDELNHYIVKRLTNLEINHIDLQWLNLKIDLFLKVATSSLINREISINKYFKYLYYYFINKPKVIIGIGSVLSAAKSTKYTVWGAGILSRKDQFKNTNFKAVRGKYSQKRIAEMGFNVPEVIGDPAILLPKIYKSNKREKYKIGIIPHFSHFESLRKYDSVEIKVINLLDSIEKIIDEINSCEYIFSTSLHGIIVSHAYEIPCLWVNFSETKEKKLVGDNIKFMDYFSSVDIDPYMPINIKDIDMSMLSIIREKEKYSLPSLKRIKEIEDGLLEVAPFPVLEKYKK